MFSYHSPIVPNVTFLNKLFISSSDFKQFLIITGVILCFLPLFASFPAISRSSAVRYYKIAAMYTALGAPTLKPSDLAFKNLLILPTGNTKPALEDLVLPVEMKAFAFFACKAYLPAFPKSFIGITFPAILSIDPVLANAFDNFFFCS